MKKNRDVQPHGRGRPSMNLKRFSIGLSQDDYEWLQALGLGSVVVGIREAVKKLRRKRGCV